jgi:predicted KAP-like P-loop ATPase
MWNDKETDVDLLGHDKIAQTILEIIKDNHLRPLTIGVYGDWGVGKSSILSLLQAKVALEKHAKVSEIHCILFNGWLFQDYEDAKTALMETVVSELAKLQPRSERIQKLAKSLLRRINWLKVAKVSSSAAMTFFTGVPLPGMLGQMSDWYKKGKELMGKEENENSKDGDSFLKEAEEESVTQQIEAFRKEFKKLIQTSKVDHIIILVDDLDRCLPKSVIEILEAIRLFLFVEGTTFVLSADEKMIEYAVREHFPNLPADYQDYTKNYLEKLIQIPIRIPLLNKAQTGNYIKLLMIQHHLKHDYEQLKNVYEHYNKQKKRPYDTMNLSYEIISEAIGSDATELKETLLVADQLTPTLASGLRGNPRNIKRFMNTLFLRMRIARIYGLEDIVKMNVLAKLMLLERFQSKKFDDLIEEVTSTDNGISSTIEADEQKKETGKGDGKVSEKKTADKQDLEWREWLSLEPVLNSVDLRPYIFISKEKAIGFDASSLFPDNLQTLLGMLNSNSDLALRTAEKQLETIARKDRILLFDKLEGESRVATDLKNIPAPIKGLLRIIKVEDSLELRMISLMVSFPPSELGPWAVTELGGLKNEHAKEKVRALFETWAGQDSNKTLQTLAKSFKVK